MKTKYLKTLSAICAAVMLIAALSFSAFAASTSVADQMAANSAAWHVAAAAGDTKTCEALHAANVALANSAASGGGSASYNSASGTWNITTSSGSTISSSGSSNGKQTTSTYTTTTSSGRTSSTSVDSYSSSSISSYKSNGGTNSGLQTAYNNDAYNVSSTGNYGDTDAVSSAAAEAAVAKELLGLTNAEAAKLQADLEAAKQDYINADNAYKDAVKSGDSAAIAAAQAQKDAAHDAAQATRAAYNYTGDSTEYNDGGYYSGGSKKTPDTSGGSFFVTDITATYKITASATDGGTITPSGTVSVKKGGSKTFTIAPSTGYKIKSVAIDGSNQGAITSYTFSNVKTTHTITAEFEKLKYNISASCGNGGSISPSGTTAVEYGASKAYTISANSGYEVADVLVDGCSIGAVNSYTFSNITGAHTISATFRANGKISIDDIDISDALGTDLSGESIKSGYGIYAHVSGSHSGVTNTKMVMTYNFGSGNNTVTLQETSTGTFVFPKNSSSPTRQRCVYIPVATKDGTYTLTLTFTATRADGTTATETKVSTITVLGSMYEDDFTGDS